MIGSLGICVFNGFREAEAFTIPSYTPVLELPDGQSLKLLILRIHIFEIASEREPGELA